MNLDEGVPFGWEIERRIDDLGLPLCDWQRDVILNLWPRPLGARESCHTTHPLADHPSHSASSRHSPQQEDQ